MSVSNVFFSNLGGLIPLQPHNFSVCVSVHDSSESLIFMLVFCPSHRFLALDSNLKLVM